ncbi:MAG: thiamine phosphate synthase [Nitrospirae bacterium]|nr:thiamine phosphate synthase [Nitrospirota bacterium]
MKPDFRLYLITDRKLFSSSEEMLKAIESALEGGVRAVQLREKDLTSRELLAMAYEVRKQTKRYGAKLFINDRIDIALAVDADGVHLGGNSMPAGAARKASGGTLMIGVSAHSVQEARNAQENGTDFITLGPVYETASKMQYGEPIGTQVLKEATRDVSVPVYAIGGIRTDRIAEVLQQGAYGVALISAILRAADVRITTAEFVRKLS